MLFKKTLAHLEFDEAQAKGIKIDFTPTGSKRLGSESSGFYEHDDRKATIGVETLDTEGVAESQKVIQHELYHAQNAEMNPDEASTLLRRGYYRAGIASRKISTLSYLGASVAFGLGIGSYLQGSNEVAANCLELGFSATAVALGSLALHRSGYINDPEEVNARKAEEADLPPLLVVE